MSRAATRPRSAPWSSDAPRPADRLGSCGLAPAAPAASSRVTSHDGVDVDARRHHGLGVDRPRPARPHAPAPTVGARGRRHDRAEVPGRLAVDEVADAVGPEGLTRATSAWIGYSRTYRDAVDHAVSLPSARGVPKPVGVKKPPMPGAGRADPLGQVALRHQLELDLARAVRGVEAPRVHLARERADDLAHPAPRISAASAVLAVARVVVHDGEVAAPCSSSALDQLDRLPGRRRTRRSSPSSRRRRRRDRLQGGPRELAPMRSARTFSRTTAIPWPTPMQIAATPQRCPRRLQPPGERAEDPGARGAERVADRRSRRPRC